MRIQPLKFILLGCLSIFTLWQPALAEDNQGVSSLFNTSETPVVFGSLPPLRREGWYIGASYVAAMITMPKVSNTEASTNTIKTTSSRLNKQLHSVSAAAGYTMDNPSVRIALEYEYYGTAPYNASPAIVGGTRSISSTVNVQALMLSLFYDVTVWSKRFYPYLVITGGADDSITNSKTTVIATGAQQRRIVHTLNYLYGGGLGAKYHMIDRFDIDVRYMYKDLGKTRWQGINGLSLKAGRMYSNEVYAGLNFHF